MRKCNKSACIQYTAPPHTHTHTHTHTQTAEKEMKGTASWTVQCAMSVAEALPDEWLLPLTPRGQRLINDLYTRGNVLIRHKDAESSSALHLHYVLISLRVVAHRVR